MSSRLARKDIIEAFILMGEQLARKRQVGEILVYGGSAIMLQMHARETTQDVDCIVSSGHGPVIEAMIYAQKKLGLPSGWLSEAVSIYASPSQDSGDFLPFGEYPSSRQPHLKVSVAKPKYLLAMKIAALTRGTKRDADDIQLLAKDLDLSSAQEAFAVYEHYFGRTPLSPQARMALYDLLGDRPSGDMEKTDGPSPKPF